MAMATITRQFTRALSLVARFSIDVAAIWIFREFAIFMLGTLARTAARTSALQEHWRTRPPPLYRSIYKRVIIARWRSDVLSLIWETRDKDGATDDVHRKGFFSPAKAPKAFSPSAPEAHAADGLRWIELLWKWSRMELAAINSDLFCGGDDGFLVGYAMPGGECLFILLQL